MSRVSKAALSEQQTCFRDKAQLHSERKEGRMVEMKKAASTVWTYSVEAGM